MTEFTRLNSEGKNGEAFKLISSLSTKAIQNLYKKDSIVCLMVDDPDNLGAALACHFLLTQTKGQAKTMKQYPSSKAIELIKQRRLKAQVFRL